MHSSIKSAALAVLVTAAGASAAAITTGDVLVYRVGTTAGTETLANTGNSVFVDEYTPAGALVQSIALPANATSGNNLIASGTASSEGLLTVSPDGKYVTLTGYNRALGGTGSLSKSTVNRTIAVIPTATGVPNVTTSLSDFAPGDNPRSAVTTTGTDLYVAGGAGGVRYTTVGSSTSTQLTTLTNFRQVNVFGGQLYATTNNAGTGTPASTVSIGTIGTGLPTTTGQSYTTLPGLDGITGTSRYAFFFADLSSTVSGDDTLYVADDGTPALTKYSLVGGAWVSNGTIGDTSNNFTGVSGKVTTNGVTLFVTNGLSLVTLTDTSGYNGAFAGVPTSLATAATGAAGTVFLGVAVVPEPASLALLGLGGLLALRRRAGRA